MFDSGSVHFNNAEMSFISAFFLTTLWIASFSLATCIFATSAEARPSVDAKAGFEYGILPSAVGAGRRSEGWFAASLRGKWNSEQIENFRVEGSVTAEFLVLSPSVNAANSQILGAPQSGEWNKSGSPQYFEDQELFAEYKFGRAANKRVSVGSKILRWGIADFYDPLDQINSRRMEKPAQSTKRGEWMLYYEWREGDSDRGPISLETFVIPLKRGAILPSRTSAWLPRQLYIPNRPDTEFLLPDALEYRYRDREDPDAALRWNLGARTTWRPSDAEFSLQYDEGAAGFPAMRASISGPLLGIRPDGRRVIQADPLVQLTEVYYRERHYGGSLVKPLGSTLLRFQFGKTEPVSSGRDLANDRADVTLALERQISLGTHGQVTVLAQGFKNTLEDDTGGTDIASFSKFFDRAAALGFRFAPNETTTVMVGALKSLALKGGTIVQSSFSMDVSPTLAVEAAWTWYEANLDSPIGPFKDNDGGSLKFTSSF